MKNFLLLLLFFGILAFIGWGIQENNGWTILFGIIAFFAYGYCVSDDSKGGPSEPRIGGPFGGDGG